LPTLINLSSGDDVFVPNDMDEVAPVAVEFR
jgi:hypothetical protein